MHRGNITYRDILTEGVICLFFKSKLKILCRRRLRHIRQLRQVKHFLQFATHRAVIRVSGHNVGHIFPPTLANISTGNRIPALFRFNLYRGKQQITRFVEVNGVVMRTVRFQHCFQFRPDGIMPTLILFVDLPLYFQTPVIT